MHRYIAAFLLLITLGSCDQYANTGADGYKFGARQYERNEVNVKIITYKNERDFNVALNRYRLSDTTVAFTVLRPPFDSCTVHMLDPSIRYEPEFIGHEFLHCVYGQWHTDNESRQ